MASPTKEMHMFWIINALVLLAIGYFIPGIHVEGFWAAMGAVFVIGAINMIVKPVFIVLTLPISILTLGLFLFVINALMFYFAGNVFSSFHVDGAQPALIGSLIYSLVHFGGSSRSSS